MVYALIDEAGSEGIWSKTIKSKTQMHDTTMRLALKNLETKRLITDMKTVEHPTRKMYIKTSIRPSDRATGGPWYTDGEMDEDFIEALATVLVNYIKSRSFYRSSRAQKAPKRGTSAAEVKAMRNAALGPTIKSENGISSKPPAANRTSTSTSTTTLLPMPPGYQSYPTLDDCTKFIANSNLTSTPLAQDDIQQLLDMLVYDQRIEKILSGSEGVAYKMSRRAAVLEEFGIENPLVQAPCGRCPVFELCEEGGPVGPSNCEYFREWLNA
jgi:DNA-directed RNA polymerase III subunit RPC6